MPVSSQLYQATVRVTWEERKIFSYLGWVGWLFWLRLTELHNICILNYNFVYYNHNDAERDSSLFSLLRE